MCENCDIGLLRAESSLLRHEIQCLTSRISVNNTMVGQVVNVVTKMILFDVRDYLMCLQLPWLFIDSLSLIGWTILKKECYLYLGDEFNWMFRIMLLSYSN